MILKLSANPANKIALSGRYRKSVITDDKSRLIYYNCYGNTAQQAIKAANRIVELNRLYNHLVDTIQAQGSTGPYINAHIVNTLLELKKLS